MSTLGRSLELYFIDGRPDGMLTAEVFNWTGHVLRLPRTQLKAALQRPQATFTGVYVLLGANGGGPLAYIGEGEDMSARLRNHAAQKEWWETAILITSTSDSLHKAHVKYLESRLVEIADSVKAVALENANVPPRSSLSEADIANMESFLETLQMVLPAIRVDIFIDKSRSSNPTLSELEQQVTGRIVFELYNKRHGVEGRAQLLNGEWIVQAGSKARATWTGNSKIYTGYSKLFEELISSGVLKGSGDHSIFMKDYAFNSPSAAAAILNGRASNGRVEWRHSPSGLTYADWETQQLNERPK